MRNSVTNPFMYVNNTTNSNPVGLGKMWIGTKDATNPESSQIQVYAVRQTDGVEIAIAQPITLSAGGVPTYNGSPVELRVDQNEYSIKITTNGGSQLYYSPNTFTDNSLRSDLAGFNSDVLVGAVRAAIIGANARFQQSIRAFDPDNLLDSDVDHSSVWQSAINASSALGIQILAHPQKYNFSTLELKSGMSILGSGTDKCFLVTSSTAGPLDPILWVLKKADDGTRARNIRIENIYIGSVVSGVSAAQDANPNLGGLCLAACENSVTNNISFGGFGQGGMVLARAAAGVEGLGFVNTTQDGNYNTGQGLFFSSCGKYNSALGAMWFKFSANSNKYLGVFGKGLSGAALLGFESANDNCIFGGASESSLSIARLTPAAGLNVRGNIIEGIRAEVVSSDAYLLTGGDSCNNNTIIGGHHTGVTGRDVNDDNAGNNRISVINFYRTPAASSSQNFPPSSDVTVNHAAGMQRFNSLKADSQKPLYKITEAYGSGAVIERAYNTITACVAGTVLWSSEIFCNDASAGARGYNAAIQARTTDTVGTTAIYVMVGRESDGLTDALKISKNEIEIFGISKALVMASPDGTRYKLTPPNGGGAATWTAV